MKTAPTDLDREAGRLFRFDFGMMVWCGAAFGRPHPSRAGRATAFCTDDSKTKGHMFQQLERLAGGELEISRNWHGATPDEFRIMLRRDPSGRRPGAEVGRGVSVGAALVAAMKTIKGET